MDWKDLTLSEKPWLSLPYWEHWEASHCIRRYQELQKRKYQLIKTDGQSILLSSIGWVYQSEKFEVSFLYSFLKLEKTANRFKFSKKRRYLCWLIKNPKLFLRISGLTENYFKYLVWSSLLIVFPI